MEWLENNLWRKYIKKALEKESRELEPLIMKHVAQWIYANPNKAIEELHTLNLIKQKYEIIQKVLDIPKRIKAMRLPDESKIENKIRSSL